MPHMEDEPKHFLEHLEDLRLTLIRIGVTLVASIMGCFIFIRPVLELFYRPMRMVGMDPKKDLLVLGVADPFMFTLMVSFFAGLTLSLPLVLYFLGLFVLPALKPEEKRMLWPSFALGALLFVAGVSFCYFIILPPSLKFFYDFSADLGFRAQWSVENYMSFVVQMLLAFGISFELPVVVLALAKLGLVDSRLLSGYRKHAIVAIVIISAIITPTSDIFTLSLMAAPMWVLYEICVWICRWMERKEARELA